MTEEYCSCSTGLLRHDTHTPGAPAEGGTVVGLWSDLQAAASEASQGNTVPD